VSTLFVNVTTNYALEEAVATEPNEPGLAATYRPHLDGLRAVAVYLVVMFHSGLGRFSGGFVGVDVFFVLSGFLVTQLLLRDIARSGSIRFGRFYARRFRRLLPAAFVALLVTAAVFAAIASPAEVVNAVGSFKAAFLYSANWFFIHQSTAYFGTDIATNPVLHFWSLAVEEQFYLVWPLALGGLFAFTRRLDARQQMNVVRIVVAVGMVASVIWALSLRTSNPNRAYYGTDTRAYQLLAGASLALVPGLMERAKRFRTATRGLTLLSFVALVMIATSWVHWDAIERGVAVTIATCVLIVAIDASDGGFVKRVLSNSSVVYLGKISYGTYLWHWLVILVAIRAFHPSPLATFGISCLVATALASLSFDMLERPIRTSSLLDRHRITVIAAGLTISVVSALVLIPAITHKNHGSTAVAAQATNTNGTPVPASLDWQHAKKGATGFTHCTGRLVSNCTLVQGTGRSIFLLGDSHAWMLIPAFQELAQRENLTFSATSIPTCPWQLNLYTTFEASTRNKTCKTEKDDVYNRVIPALHPDVVVVVNQPYDDPTLPTSLMGADGRVQPSGSDGKYDLLSATTKAAIAALQAPGRDVVIVEPFPRSELDPLACISKAKVLEECRYVTSASPTRLELMYRQIAKDDQRVWSADLDRLECPYDPICDPVVNDQIVKIDQGHMSAAFSRSIGPEIDAYLKQIGVIRS
jgi:peptidoglycan/LPS O-acetylase OafA/YrhL